MNTSKESYENMRTLCESLKSEYERMRISLQNDVQSFNNRTSALNEEIQSWNRKGSISENEHARLMSLKTELNSIRESIDRRDEEMRRLAEEINRVVKEMNQIADRQRLDVDNYRKVGDRLGEEFQEGFFLRNKGKKSITIYHFENEEKLIRLLAHELGHALGLKHSQNPSAIMYWLNQSHSLELADDDLAALKVRCNEK